MRIAFTTVSALLISTYAPASLAADALEQRPVVQRGESFKVTEGGGFLTKTWKELGSQEAAQIITAACWAYGYDCSAEAEAVRQAAIESYRRFSRGKYRGTFRVRQSGEEWRGQIVPPPGYRICKLYTPLRKASLTGGSTFNATINGNYGVSVYAVIPKNRSTRQWANFVMVASFVPEEDYASYSCWAPRTAAVRCKGPVTCRSKRIN